MASNTIRVASIYFLFCGLTGFFWPESWYMVAGLSADFPAVLIRITGALLLAIGGGFWRAHGNPSDRPLVIQIGLWATIADFAAVLWGIGEGELPLLPGLGFLVVDLLWVIALFLVQRELKKTALTDIGG